jgi:DNA replicative helicase MCM subunit Mcm2 (Cdc46/Mcm family)
LRQLDQRATHLSPADQLNKDIRNIAKLADFDERRRQLEESVRWYLALKLKVNVLDQRHPQPQKLAREVSRAALKSAQLKVDPALREELSQEIEAFFREVRASGTEASAPVTSHWESLEQLARRVITASEKGAREKGGP